jgi:predicted O-methyltransferase YrrM
VPVQSEHVQRYLHDLRPQRSPVMQEMEQFAEREAVPIVHWETGRFLATLVRALKPKLVLEVGTAIGYSSLHMAQELSEGAKLITIDRDPQRIREAHEYHARAGVADRVEIVEGDALEVIDRLDGPFDLIFLDGTKIEYPRYLELVEPKAAENAALVVDNMLMSGDVALEDDSEARWTAENLAMARGFNHQAVRSDRWLGAVLPIGDGIVFAAHQA